MLRCYCCGKELGKNFTLVSLSEDADRVFVLADDHVALIDDAQIKVPVEICS
jgi:hypothetical protein